MTLTFGIHIACSVVLFLLVTGAAYTDIAHGRIYNWMTGSALLCGILLNTVAGGFYKQGLATEPSFVMSGLGALVATACLLPFCLSGSLGAGDLKLMAAIGALTGWLFTLTALMYSAFFGLGITLVILAANGLLWQGVKNSFRFLILPTSSRIKRFKESATGKITIPYGAAIAAGTIVTWYMRNPV